MKNSFIVYITLIAIALIVAIPTTYTVIKNHHEKLLKVTYGEIEYAAKKCYFDEICKEDKTTLKTLYDNKYLEKQSNPVTKEFFNEESYVKRTGRNFKFVEIKEK